ncbi:sialate O-acetylesterase [Rubritalea spongiae]|uniref:Sialate O-acetylesterase n=1 Tax=Rubritalea spongiae TaxID=430797 RepID=A0ABW5E288_9BACT
MKTSIVTLLFCCSVLISQSAPRPRHLFIFAGENNMESLKPERTVIPPLVDLDKDLKKVDLLWMRMARRTMAMHDVDSDWTDSDGNEKASYGSGYSKTQAKEYERLLETARDTARKKECDTIVLFWMQGESDAQKGWGDQYAASFQRFVKQLEADMELGKLDVVLVRLSDHGLQEKWQKKYPDWAKVRAAQEKLVHANKGWILIDTDDLNGKQNKLQFDKKGIETLGERYAEAALKLVGAVN